VVRKGGDVQFPKGKPTPLFTVAAGRLPQSGLPGLGQPSHRAEGSLLGTRPSNKFASGGLLTDDARAADLYELGLTNVAMGFHVAAIDVLRDCTARQPGHAAAWRKLAQLLRLADQDAEAQAAEAAAKAASSRGLDSEADAAERSPGQPEKAERKLRDMLRGKTEAMALLRDRLTANPREVAAMRLLAQRELQAGDTMTAWSLLERTLEICPNYIDARADYADSLLQHRSRLTLALEQTARLLARAPGSARYRRMHAYALTFTGQPAPAADVLAQLVRENPREARDWCSFGQALHALGRRDESEAAFRKCLALQPDMGEAYWGLTDLKGKYIKQTDIAAIRDLLDEDWLEPASRMHMLYAMAQALEQAGDFSASFAAYEQSARLSRAIAIEKHKGYKPRTAVNRVRRQKAVFSRENLSGRLGQAPTMASGPTPIFIVGMPRAGSTLVEQILASHRLVEGTSELPLIADLTQDLAFSRILVTPDAYPECLLDLSGEQLAALGAQVIDRAADYLHHDRPYFVDKRPFNWLEAGLIHMILPQAKIIDIRREPMAACFAMFKQMLPIETSFSKDLGDLGHYYNHYVSMMDHWRTVLPGRIHFIQYERLVDDTETEIRRLLDYCGLPFEDGCLRFWENDRAVSTPSSEQVRRPIFRSALQQWRNFEPWLGPLRDALDQPAEA
jgi:tetratricopeptide (TPR) repeat protein